MEFRTLAGLVLLVFMVVMLTGIHRSLVHSSAFGNIVVGTIYFLGVFALYTMYESRRYKDRQRKVLMLLMGFLAMLIAYFSLEALYQTERR